MIIGIVVVSIAAYFVMMALSKPYEAENQYFLKDAQSKLFFESPDFSNYNFKICNSGKS
jgi:hypothetical protein